MILRDVVSPFHSQTLFLPVLRIHPKEDEKTTVDTDCHFGVQFYAATAVIRPGKSGNLRR
jgi:hypothetical protein